jgi:protein-tyrosine phosphatase
MPVEPKKITPRVYQGGWILPSDVPVLVDIGITHILNLDLPPDDPAPFQRAGLRHKTFSLIDGCLMLPQRVRDIMNAIDGCLSSPAHKIYVHCVEGVSRSPTIVWLYLIHSGMSPEQARAVIHPNPLLYDDVIVGGLIRNRA